MRFSSSTKSSRSQASKRRLSTRKPSLPLKTIPSLDPPNRCAECHRGQHFRCMVDCMCEHGAYFKRWPGAEYDMEVSIRYPRKLVGALLKQVLRPELRPLEYCWLCDAPSVDLIRDLTTFDLPFPACKGHRNQMRNHELFVLDDWCAVVRKDRIATKSTPFGRATILIGNPYVKEA